MTLIGRARCLEEKGCGGGVNVPLWLSTGLRCSCVVEFASPEVGEPEHLSLIKVHGIEQTCLTTFTATSYWYNLIC